MHYTQGGSEYGPSHDGTCGVLAWEAYFNIATRAPADEVANTQWAIRRYRAEVQGWQFDEPQPKSRAELELEDVIEARGWTDVAKELAP
jgi:hypothetical protein